MIWENTIQLQEDYKRYYPFGPRLLQLFWVLQVPMVRDLQDWKHTMMNICPVLQVAW